MWWRWCSEGGVVEVVWWCGGGGGDVDYATNEMELKKALSRALMQ